ncbi:hypothetical protein E4S40_09150 [Algoriphagus kandeliae]|uniref:Uncharacterized protein n=1 Tax=Algoriphagus kandeliae TaxID=2562278 RepID=A0A4Y9QSQ3_9BACT|nr:hypothetical protein [Algoriphagus kandeliae]TFV94196.1 hypothetical protein E4S40_09150 [Algoriphagus kandeliae]
MKTFNYQNRNLFSGPHLLGLILVLVGIFVLISPSFLESGSSLEKVITVGVATLIIGLIILSSYRGTLLDFSKNRYKNYFSILGFRFGEWNLLPQISKIEVLPYSYKSQNVPNGISPTLSGKVNSFKVILHSNSYQRIFSFDYSNLNKAVKKANQIASDSNSDLIIPSIQ